MASNRGEPVGLEGGRLATVTCRQSGVRVRIARWLPALVCAACVAMGAQATAATTHGDGTRHSSTKAHSDGSKLANPAVDRLLTDVPATTLDTIGAGHGTTGIVTRKLSGRPLRADGKPEMLVETLGWCPHCAAANFSLAIALSRFGRLGGLHAINTGTYYPSPKDIWGISFERSSYTSSALSFTDVILQSVNAQPFESFTKAEQAAIATFDKQEAAPAIDVGGGYGFSGIPFDPNVLAHKTTRQTAELLSDPTDPIAVDIDGFANVITAAICTETDQQPSGVCASAGVTAAAKDL
jgi:Domain of unknown function (DUF929)